MAGKGGGAWKVAYADFVTAMMAFFLVMWIVAQNKPVREAVASYFRDPYGLSPLPGKSNSLLPLKDAGPSPLDKNPLKGSRRQPTPGLDETSQPAKSNRIAVGDLSATVGTQIFFEEESADLDDRSQRVLEQLLSTLQGSICKVEIRGHASGRRLPASSPFKDAWGLSYSRAVATMHYLLQKGIDPRRIRLSQSGPNDPNLRNDTSGQRLQNSRVEVFVLNEVIMVPSDVDGRRGDRANRAKAGPISSGK